MRILHYLQQLRLEDGGVVRAVIDICNLLAAHGHQVTFLSCDPSDAPAEWKNAAPGAARIVQLPPVRGPLGLLPRSGMRIVERELGNADALHLHGMWERSNYQFAFAAMRQRVPYIYSSHGMLDDWAMGMKTAKKRIMMAMVARRVLEGARSVHCAAKGELEESAKWFPRGRGQVVPLVFDLEPFRSLPGPDLAREKFEHLRKPLLQVLFLSRLVENKGADVLIEAAAMLRADGQELMLTIAGSGDASCEQHLRSLAEKRGLGEHCVFIGHIAGALKVSLFQAADIFILPTVHENFGFATIEALAAERPAITTPGTKIWRELEEGGGVRIAERNPGALAEAMRALLDPECRRAMGQAGRRWVLEYLEPHRLVELYANLYREGLKAEPPELAVQESTPR